MKRKWVFLGLLVLFFILRFYPIWQNNFPFAYDNAKDSLVLMQMGEFRKPALLGAATSLEGLYQGPFWYYVLFPINFLLGYHPFASVLTVIFLGAFTLFLYWRYLGVLPALFYTVSFLGVSTQQTSWSPYFTIFSSSWILVLLTLVKRKPKTSHLVLLALATGSLFAAEIAFGVVFTLILILVILFRKIKPTKKQILISTFAFFILFVPQIVFELRHDFLQTKSVIRFVANYSSESSIVQGNAKGIERIFEVVEYVGDNALNSISPSFLDLMPYVSIFAVATFLYATYKEASKSEKEKVWGITTPFIFGSMLLYLFLPVKSFYLVGLTPFWIYIVSNAVHKKFRNAQKSIAILLILWAVFEMFLSRANYEQLSKSSRILFSSKLEAVKVAYELSEGKPFDSFQYVPEIYDYTYQHIYQYLGKRVPTEYSYLPGESSYMQTIKKRSEKKDPGSTILIIEKGENNILFDSWWEKVTTNKKIPQKVEVNDTITVYKLDD